MADLKRAVAYRVGELRALKVSDLDLAAFTLKLGADFTKNRKHAEQPIPTGFAKILADSVEGKPEDAPLLDIPSSKAWKHFKQDLEAAGIEERTRAGRATWHSLRKTFVDLVVATGADLKTNMELARHSAAQMSFEIYASRNARRLRAASDAASKMASRVILGPTWSAFGAREGEGDCVEPSPESPGATGSDPSTEEPEDDPDDP